MKRFNDTYLIFFRHYVYENMYIGLILSSHRFDIIMWCLISFHGMSKLLYRNKPQFYIQLIFKAPLCITLTISDQKIVSGSLFFQFLRAKKENFKIFYKRVIL